MPDPPLLRAAFDSRTASATLSWSRALTGFDHYEIHRQIQGEQGTLILHGTTIIDDTTFTDTGLRGDTDYTYTAVTQLNTGKELKSTPVKGKIHALLREMEWREPNGSFLDGEVALGPDGLTYVNDTLLDRISLFNDQGVLLDQIQAEPSSGPQGFESADLAAGNHGLYILRRESGVGVASYVNAFDPLKNPLFRWPATGTRSNLTALTLSPDGDLSVSRADVGGAGDTLYVLDPITGALKNQLILERQQNSAPSGRTRLSIGDGIGLLADGSGLTVFDTFTGGVLPVGIPGNSRIFDLVWGSNDRLFVLYLDPPRVEVLRDWQLLTTWFLEETGGFHFQFKDRASPAGISLDAQGNITILDPFVNRLRIQIFDP